MDLADHRYPVVGQALDEVHLPQRTAAVQRRAGDLADCIVEFAPATRGVELPWPDVIVEVDLTVLPPHRVVEPHRNVDKFVAKRRQLVEPAGDDVTELLDSERPPTHVLQVR